MKVFKACCIIIKRRFVSLLLYFGIFLALSVVMTTISMDTYSPDFWYLEAFSAEASKQNAVTYLRETYGYKRVVGFGDNLNDLPMFAACDVRVAVENAKPDVIAAADQICGANDRNGVAKWLEENHHIGE